MCGIIAVSASFIEHGLERALTILDHRGPDSRGSWTNADGRCALGATRLAIRDLSDSGSMPMGNDDESVVLTFNGEIYNHVELRTELEGKGHRFRSTGDTEIALKAYEEYGPRCVDRLEGMFALAVWDSLRDHLFIARDHFGVKPLYYVQDGDRFACASEVKALRTLPWVKAPVDPGALHQYLTFLWVPDPLTMFEGIFKLEAGHCAIFRGGQLVIERYWDLHFPDRAHRFEWSEGDLVAESAISSHPRCGDRWSATSRWGRSSAPASIRARSWPRCRRSAPTPSARSRSRSPIGSSGG